MWTELAAIGAGALVVIALVFGLVKMLTKVSREGASEGERADRLAENARRTAEAEEARSQPLSGDPRTVAQLWRLRRKLRKRSKSG